MRVRAVVGRPTSRATASTMRAPAQSRRRGCHTRARGPRHAPCPVEPRARPRAPSARRCSRASSAGAVGGRDEVEHRVVPARAARRRWPRRRTRCAPRPRGAPQYAEPSIAPSQSRHAGCRSSARSPRTRLHRKPAPRAARAERAHAALGVEVAERDARREEHRRRLGHRVHAEAALAQEAASRESASPCPRTPAWATPSCGSRRSRPPTRPRRARAAAARGRAGDAPPTSAAAATREARKTAGTAPCGSGAALRCSRPSAPTISVRAGPPPWRPPTHESSLDDVKPPPISQPHDPALERPRPSRRRGGGERGAQPF